MFRWNLLLRKVFASSPSVRKATTTKGILARRKARSAKLKVKPTLEGLEDRLVPSASASTASVGMEVNSPMVSTMAPWTPVLMTLENDLIRIEQAIIQSIAQEMAVAQQQWGHLLGIDTSSTNASTNAVVPPPVGSSGNSNGLSSPNRGQVADQNGGGTVTDSGSNSRTKPSAAVSAMVQPLAPSGDTDGSGNINGSINGNINANPGIAVNLVNGVISGGLSGGFDGNCVHDFGNEFFAGGGTLGDGTNFSLTPGTYSLTVNGTSLTGSFKASGNGSDGDVVQVNGTFNGTVDANGNITSGSYTGTILVLDPATVDGQVWLDNNGDGSLDDGEMGFSGITVNLDSSTGQQLLSTTTDSNGNYQFNVQSLLSQYSSFEVQVVIPDGDEATYQSAQSVIDADGYSPVFALAAGEAEFVPAGLRSLRVTTTQDDAGGPIKNEITLRDAIETANNPLLANPIITFKSGLSGTIELQEDVEALDSNIIIAGPGASQIQVTSNGTVFAGFLVRPNRVCEIDGLGISGFISSFGGAINNAATLTLVNDVISNNTAEQGGGIYNSGDLSLVNDVISGNQVLIGPPSTGAGIYNAPNATVFIHSCTITGNTAQNAGGGIDNEGIMQCYLTQIYGNKAGTNGGAGDGGGVYNGAGANIPAMSNCQIYNNQSGDGGGLYFAGGDATISTGQITGNRADYHGGGIYVAVGTLTIKNSSTIKSNIAQDDGGGIAMYAGGIVRMAGGSIVSNQVTRTTSTGRGGGIYVGGGSFTLTGSVSVSFNKALNGAGMYVDDQTVSVSGGTFQFNTAKNNGGGIYNNAGTLTLKGGAYIGTQNSAIQGGGMYLNTTSTTTFNGCTVQGNSATQGGVGVYWQNGATVNPNPPNPPNLSDKDDPGGQPFQGP